MNIEQERADFEWWVSDEGGNLRAVERVGECYKLAQIQSYWVAWQTRAALQSQDRADAGLVEALERLMFAARDRDNSTGCQIRLVVAQAELRDAARHAADCLETLRNPEEPSHDN